MFRNEGSAASLCPQPLMENESKLRTPNSMLSHFLEGVCLMLSCCRHHRLSFPCPPAVIYVTGMYILASDFVQAYWAKDTYPWSDHRVVCFLASSFRTPEVFFWSHIEYPQGNFPFPLEKPPPGSESHTPFHSDGDGNLYRDLREELVSTVAASECVGLNLNPELRTWTIKCYVEVFHWPQAAGHT